MTTLIGLDIVSQGSRSLLAHQMAFSGTLDTIDPEHELVIGGAAIDNSRLVIGITGPDAQSVIVTNGDSLFAQVFYRVTDEVDPLYLANSRVELDEQARNIVRAMGNDSLMYAQYTDGGHEYSS